ncbi:MAG: septum formation inhibitor Maf [Myxococcaceae bacterium]|nr:septum formation inhibitor Maf [Myxococcaceae bacterium]
MGSFVLASSSPRRRELLGQLGLTFDVEAADLDESPQPGERAAAYVERLAREKATAVRARRPGAVVLAADTSVVVDDELLGKPGTDAALGTAMLRRLSGRTHQVLTGVAVAGPTLRSLVVSSDVAFRPLSDAQIAWYVSTGEGADKAGGYASQARAGAFIRALTGSATSVIGLPLDEAVRLLEEAGVRMPWSVG